MIAILPILSEPTAAVQPGDGTLDDPALGFNDKALGVRGGRVGLNSVSAPIDGLSANSPSIAVVGRCVGRA